MLKIRKRAQYDLLSNLRKKIFGSEKRLISYFQVSIRPISEIQKLILYVILQSDPDSKHSDRKKSNEDIAFYWDSKVAEGDNGYTFYSKIVDNVIEEYTNKTRLNTDKSITDFDFTTLGDCGKNNYGYDSNSPCVFFRLNRVSLHNF